MHNENRATRKEMATITNTYTYTYVSRPSSQQDNLLNCTSGLPLECGKHLSQIATHFLGRSCQNLIQHFILQTYIVPVIAMTTAI